MNGINIIATGSATPVKVVTNDDMARLVDTSDEWITERTGIRRRRFISGDESTTSLSITAGWRALQASGIPPDQIGACIVATITPDTMTPSTANKVAAALELPTDMPSLDIGAACTGFIYALRVAQGLVTAGSERPYALVIGAESLSRSADMSDRTTCVLFADGAGAAIVKADPDAVFHSWLGAEYAEAIGVPGAGNPDGHITMDGRPVFRFAVRIIPRIIRHMLTMSGQTLDDIDQVICHQANSRIINHAVKKLKADPAKFYQNLDHFGNTSGASIPLALDELVQIGRIAPGARLLLAGFGGGLTYGGTAITYRGPEG